MREDSSAVSIPNLKVSALVAWLYSLHSFFMKNIISQMHRMNFTSQSMNDTAIDAIGADMLSALRKMKIPDTAPSTAPAVPALLQRVLIFRF
jgi:hypothetical protein